MFHLGFSAFPLFSRSNTRTHIDVYLGLDIYFRSVCVLEFNNITDL